MGRHDLHRAVIVTAKAQDAEAVIALWRDCALTRPWNDPRADFERALAATDAAILILRADEAVVGSVMVGWDGHRGWVYYLAVASAHRRQGLGRELMQAAEDWLKARDCPKIQLMVREDNEAALAFYGRLGLERQAVVTLGRFFDGDGR